MIAIVGWLMALLLPAVQAARRAECKSRLKQVGVALGVRALDGKLLGSYPIEKTTAVAPDAVHFE